MATSNEAYRINCLDEWRVFYTYWREKPGCIDAVIEDLRAKGHLPGDQTPEDANPGAIVTP